MDETTHAEAAKLAALDMMPMDIKAPLVGYVANQARLLGDFEYDLTMVSYVPPDLEPAFNMFRQYYVQLLAAHGEGGQAPSSDLTW